VLKSVRVADGDRDLTDPHAPRIAQAGKRQRRPIDPEARPGRLWTFAAHHIGAHRTVRRQRHQRVRGHIHHVTVRDRNPSGVNSTPDPLRARDMDLEDRPDADLLDAYRER